MNQNDNQKKPSADTRDLETDTTPTQAEGDRDTVNEALSHQGEGKNKPQSDSEKKAS